MDMRQDLHEHNGTNGLPLFCIYYLARSYLEVVVKIAVYIQSPMRSFSFDSSRWFLSAALHSIAF
jgi:hypothetical protein